MERIKRAQNFSKIKSQQNPSIHRLEDLSNEIFCEIFDYLDGYDTYKAFSNLNIRFKNLLLNPLFLMKIEFFYPSTFDHHCKQFLLSNKHHILSLNLSNESMLDKLISSCIINSSFYHLESIIFYEITIFKLLIFLFHLNSLPRLFSLSIRVFECYDNLGDIFGVLFRFPVLKYLKFEVSENEDVTVKIPIAGEGQTSTIEYLSIHFWCAFNELADLLSYAPRLTRLSCSNLVGPEKNIKFEVLTKLTHLTHLNIVINDSKFDEFERLLLNICSQLKLLRITMKCSDKTYLDGHRWERIITQKMPLLNEFIFRYNDEIHEYFAIYSYHSLINRFTSPFWIKRKWMLSITVEDHQILYVISPYRESSYDFPLPDQPGADLDLTHPFPSDDYQLFLYKIRSLSEMIEMTRLSVDCTEITPDLLIRILNSLPNLDSLSISDLPSYDDIFECIDDENQINKFLKNNKITKITLANISNIDEISVIMHYFPRLLYLAIESVKELEFPTMVEEVLSMIKLNEQFHPTVVCIFDAEAEHDVLDKLKQIIDSKHLLKDYKIHRRFDRFYFHWK